MTRFVTPLSFSRQLEVSDVCLQLTPRTIRKHSGRAVVLHLPSGYAYFTATLDFKLHSSNRLNAAADTGLGAGLLRCLQLSSRRLSTKEVRIKPDNKLIPSPLYVFVCIGPALSTFPACRQLRFDFGSTATAIRLLQSTAVRPFDDLRYDLYVGCCYCNEA